MDGPWTCAILFTAACLHLVAALNHQSASSGLSSVASLSWAPRWIHGGTLRDPRSIHKRSVGVAALKPNLAYQPCLTPSGAKGRCRHLQYCILQDFRTNFPRLLDYMCIIERSFVGVCCPEQPGLGGVLPPSSLAGILPAVAQGQPEGDPPPPPGLPPPRRPKLRGCGQGVQASKAPTGGGGLADPGEWPWMVALLKQDELQFCGGVLITDRHVLTASHCLVNIKAEDLIVRLGEYDLEDEGETRSRDFLVSEIRRHEDFVKATYENDIAVLKLQRPVVFNSYMWPVCLPPADKDFVNASAVVAGWGTLGFGAPPADILMEVSIPVWPQEKCKSMYAQPILDHMMCAGGYEGGKDACQGDSGGPLLLQAEDGSWSTIGVVSWGIRCGEPTHPGVYIRVNHFLPWILKNCDF